MTMRTAATAAAAAAVLAALLAHGGSTAAAIELIGSKHVIGYYASWQWYDRDKLVLSGGDVTYWRRVDFALPQQFRTFVVASALFREQINCDDHTIRVHAQVFRAADGAIVEQVNHPIAEPVPIIPDTVGDALWRSVCPLVASHRAAEDRLKATQERLDNRRRELDRLRVEVEDLEASVARLRTESRDPARDVVREGVREPARETPRQPGRQGI